MLIVALGVGAAVTATQQTYSSTSYEYGKFQTIEGILFETPAPQLLVTRPGAAEVAPFSRYMMVSEGKIGAWDAAKGLHGKTVSVEGALIYRDGQTMIELSSRPIEPLPGETGETPAPAGRSLGEHTLIGEIVDSKYRALSL